MTLFTRLHPGSESGDGNLLIIGADYCATLLFLVHYISSFPLRFITPLINTARRECSVRLVRVRLSSRVRLTFADRDHGRVRFDSTRLLDLAFKDIVLRRCSDISEYVVCRAKSLLISARHRTTSPHRRTRARRDARVLLWSSRQSSVSQVRFCIARKIYEIKR